MATQTLEFSAGTGLTISCKLFAVGSDTVVATATATEKTNDTNRYSVAYTNIPAGAYRLNGFVSGTGGFANEVYDLTLTTATFQPRSESSVDSGAIADAVWDEPYAGHTISETAGEVVGRLAPSVSQIIQGTVDTVTNGHTPTTIEFQAGNITEATADHYNGRVVIFTSGVLAGQATSISDYQAVGGIGQFSVVALTEAPSSNDTFVIV